MSKTGKWTGKLKLLSVRWIKDRGVQVAVGVEGGGRGGGGQAAESRKKKKKRKKEKKMDRKRDTYS